MENTKVWVEMFEERRMSAVAIGKAVGADPTTVSTYLQKHGKEIHQGLHRKDRQPPKISPELATLLAKGPEEVLKFLDERVWGISASEGGRERLKKVCDFLKVPLTVGRDETAKRLDIDESMVNAWTEGTKQPYLVKAANVALQASLTPGWKLLPQRLESGGNEQGSWIKVPVPIRTYHDIIQFLSQTGPLSGTYERATRFGLSREDVFRLRPELFAYTLGMMVGDSGKLGGVQKRFTSVNLSLFLSKKHPDNEALGEFMSMCVNTLGIEMKRIKDGEPSGATKLALDPTGSFRWNSSRSPLLAWVFYEGFGLKEGQKTSYDPVHMDWIFDTPFEFRKRFVQGLADSDGTVRNSVVEVCSVPNAQFTAKVLQSIGMASAHVRKENNQELRTVVSNADASRLPIFNEFVKSYRYQKLMASI